MTRRYSEDEVAEVLARASRRELERVSPGDAGLTLEEIQDIGREVGIPAHELAAAARELSVAPRTPFPLRSVRRGSAMTRVVTLPGAPAESEWDRMVVALREVFEGPGSVEETGSLRSWFGDGVEVHGEPVGDGYRIRIQAKDDTAVQAVGVGAASIVVAAIMAGALAVSGAGDAFTFGASGLVGLVGATSAAYGRYVLARWRRRTTRRLAEAAERLSGPTAGREGPTGA